MIRKIWERVRRLFGRKRQSRQDGMVIDDSGLLELRERVAEARSKGECPKEQALEMAERGAELDTQEGLGEIEVVTDGEE